MIEKELLPNKIKVVYQYLPQVYSVATGIWLKVGSAGEQQRLLGISHFLEHMLFKGTSKRSAKELAEALESVGGQMNAYTTKEYTCFYAKTLADDFELAVDVLSDMYHDSLFDPQETDKEREVILEEINMYEDSPEDIVHDILATALWQGHPYGLPTIGTKQSVNAITADDLRSYCHNSYCPDTTVIVVAGNIDKARVMQVLGQYFSRDGGQSKGELICPPQTFSSLAYKWKDTEQTHLCLGVPAVRDDDPDFHTAHLLTMILGGGVSSRLFQEAREKRGLCYAAYSYCATYSKGGYLAAYASTSPDKLTELLKVVCEQLDLLKNQPLYEGELLRAQQQLKVSILMAMENPSSVMQRIGRQEISLGRVYTPEDSIAKIMAVSEKDVIALAKRLFSKDRLVVATVGPKETAIDLGALL